MKHFLISLVFLISSQVFAQVVTVDIEAVDLEASYIEYTGYVNERDHNFVARANPNTLTLSYSPDSLDQNFSLEITALANDFDSGNWFRDQNGRRTVFETKKYPELKFTSQSLSLDTDAENQAGTIEGQITIKEIVKEVSVPVTILLEDSKLVVDGEFSVLLSEFEINRPSAIGDVVDDDILIAFHIELNSEQ